ncbi:alkaline phosphatase family protein [Alcaligenes faecalis]
MTLPRLVWFLVDGLPHELVCAYSAMRPHSKLAKLHSQGRTASLTPLTPNCQTPPSLFTIWSGHGVEKHGLLGYDVPRCVDGDPTSFGNGFEIWPREIDMAWDLYAKRRQTIRACAVPFLQADRLTPWLLSATDVFHPPVAAARVFVDGEALSIPPLTLRVEISDSEILLRDDQGREYWHCVIESDQPEAPLVLPGTVPGDSHFALILRGARVDGQPRLISLGYHAVQVHGTAAEARKRNGYSQPYVVSNPGKLYASGALGKRMNQGGQGAAEHLLVTLMRDVHNSFAADILDAVQTNDADLVVGYYPVIDLLSHQLLRYVVTDDGATLNGPLADFFYVVMDWLDSLVIQLSERIAPKAKFIINSDHGMLPIEWDISPNVFFVRQGWLSLRSDGTIDAHRSAVFFHPAENGLIVFHRERLHKTGLTRDDVINKLARAINESGLLGLKAIAGTAATLGDTWQANLYLQPPAAARLRANIAGELVKHSDKGGDHTVHGPQPWLRGTLIDAGPVRWLAAGEDELALTQILDLALAPPICSSYKSSDTLEKTPPNL